MAEISLGQVFDYCNSTTDLLALGDVEKIHTAAVEKMDKMQGQRMIAARIREREQNEAKREK